LIVVVLAPFIADHWLQSQSIARGEIVFVVRVMGASIAFQLPASLYIGGLMGLQKQVSANILQVAWSLLRGIGSVIVLWAISPSIVAFAIWQMIANVVYLACSRRGIWRAVSAVCGSSVNDKPQFVLRVLKKTWRYAIGMAGTSVIYIFLTQIDKLAVSKMMSLEMFGYYMLAVTLASLPTLLASPISTAVFPRLAGCVEKGDQGALSSLYHRTTSFVGALIIPTGLTLVVFAGDFIFAWTGEYVIAENAEVVASLLLLGAMVQALSIMPYNLALAHGNVRINLCGGLVSVVLMILILPFLIRNYGVAGSGMAWLFMNLLTMPVIVFHTHRLFLPGEFMKWLTVGVLVPTSAAFPLVISGRWLLPDATSRVEAIVGIGAVWTIAAASTAVLVPELRALVLEQLRKFVANRREN
jgi:O-antigen/teichoic acid export membrane protein